MKHALRMLLGCGLAFLLAFLLPALGVNGTVSLMIFFALMVGCHLLMGSGMHRKEEDEQQNRKN